MSHSSTADVPLDHILTDCILSTCPTPQISQHIQFSSRNRCTLATQGTFVAKTFYRAKYHLLEYLAAKEYGKKDGKATGSGASQKSSRGQPSSIASGGSLLSAVTSQQSHMKHKKKRRLAMMQNQRVKFKIGIIGLGSLGGMLLEGLLNVAGDLFSGRDVIVVTRRKDQDVDHLLSLHGISKEQANQIVVTQNLKWALRQCDLVYLCVLPSQFQYLDFDCDDAQLVSASSSSSGGDSSLSFMENILNRKKSAMVQQENVSKKSEQSDSPVNLCNRNKVFVSFVSGIPHRKVCNTVHSELVLTLQLSPNQKFKSQFSQLTSFRRSLREVLQNALFVRFASPHDSFDTILPQHSGTRHSVWLKDQFYPVMARYLQQQSGSSSSIHTHHLIAMAIDHCVGHHVSSENIDRVFQAYLRKNFTEKNSSSFWMNGDFLEECMVLEMHRQRELESRRQNVSLRPAQFLQQDTLSAEYRHEWTKENDRGDTSPSAPLSPKQTKPPSALFEQNQFLKWFQELVYCKS